MRNPSPLDLDPPSSSNTLPDPASLSMSSVSSPSFSMPKSIPKTRPSHTHVKSKPLPAHRQEPTSAPVIPSLNDARRKLYLYHEQVIAALAGKDRAYTDAHAQASATASASQSASEAVQLVQNTEAQLLAHLQTLQRNRFRRAFFPGKTAEDMARLQQRLVTVSAEVAVARRKAHQLSKKAKGEASKAKALRGDAELLAASERARRDILMAVYFEQRGRRRCRDDEPISSTIENRPRQHSHLCESTRSRVRSYSRRNMTMDGWLESNNMEMQADERESLAIQDDALRLLYKARTSLMEVRRNLGNVLARCCDDAGGSSVQEVSEYGYNMCGASSRHELKRAAWQTREAGKRIERAVGMSERLPIRQLVEAWDRTAFLDISDILSEESGSVQEAVQKAVRIIESVAEVVRESIGLQATLVEVMRDRLEGGDMAVERTSEDVDPIRAQSDLMMR